MISQAVMADSEERRAQRILDEQGFLVIARISPISVGQVIEDFYALVSDDLSSRRRIVEGRAVVVASSSAEEFEGQSRRYFDPGYEHSRSDPMWKYFYRVVAE
jgi:hypothetical protein